MIIGSDLKINISLEGLPDNTHLNLVNFKCIFYVNPDKTYTVNKSLMTEKDADNYVAQFDSTNLGYPGTVLAIIIADIPDNGSTRKEIAEASTGVVLTLSPINLPK